MKQHRNGSILWITVLGLFLIFLFYFLFLLLLFCFCILRWKPYSLLSNQIGRIVVRSAELVGSVSYALFRRHEKDQLRLNCGGIRFAVCPTRESRLYI
jgi:hypothetical protein